MGNGEAKQDESKSFEAQLKNLRWLLRQKRISQRALAKDLNMPTATINNMLTGKASPSGHFMKKINSRFAETIFSVDPNHNPSLFRFRHRVDTRFKPATASLLNQLADRREINMYSRKTYKRNFRFYLQEGLEYAYYLAAAYGAMKLASLHLGLPFGAPEGTTDIAFALSLAIILILTPYMICKLPFGERFEELKARYRMQKGDLLDARKIKIAAGRRKFKLN